ncbi:protein tyrosine phosphatase receptor type C-associated protein [Glossophaga mutica]
MDLACALWLWTLLALPGVLGSSAQDGKGSSTVTVVLLLLLLLLLATGLALAWRRLSRDSGGYYHPARLGAALWGRTRRLLWASPPGRWLRARESANEDPEGQEDEQDVEDDSFDGGQKEVRAREEEQSCGEQLSPQRGPEPAQEAPSGDVEGGLGLSPQGPEGSSGSAEALLSDLHAFAGSAAWDDSTRPAGGQGLHVTAL